jgi:tetratricopeptide (TPR) repeat protein
MGPSPSGAFRFLTFLFVALGTGIWLFQQESTRRAEALVRQTNARQALDTGILQAYESGKAERLQEAELHLSEAASHLANADSAELGERLAQAEADVQFAQHLVDIRQSAMVHFVEHSTSSPHAHFKLLISGYPQAFQQAGIDLDAEPGPTARQISNSPFSEITIAALEEWAISAFMLKRHSEQKKLLKIVGLIDPESDWCARFRNPEVWSDEKGLRTLAEDAIKAESPPPAHQLTITATLLRNLGAKSEGLNLLREAVRRRPADFWSNFEIGSTYFRERKYKEAASFFRIMVALQPQRPWILNRLGTALVLAGDFDEGLTLVRDAVKLEPTNGDLRKNLVVSLIKAGRVSDGLTAARQTFEAEPNNAEAATTYGMALSVAGQPEASIAMYRKAVSLSPMDFIAQHDLSSALGIAGHLEEAVAEFRKTIALDKTLFGGHLGLCMSLFKLRRYEEALPEFEWFIRDFDPRNKREDADLGNGLDSKYIIARRYYSDALFRLGRFKQAQTEIQTFLDLPPLDISARERLKQQLENGKTLIPLESHIPAILGGAEVQGNPSQMCALAEWCYLYRHIPVISIRHYSAAFKKGPTLAEDLDAKYRFHAACAAVLAGYGNDSESAKLDDQTRAGFRKQSLEWLLADLRGWVQRRADSKHGQLPTQAAVMWQQHPDLAVVREPQALAKLPETERQNWQNLWSEVKALAVNDAGQILLQARAHVDHKRWAQAAESYAQLKYAESSDFERWFEFAAVQLLVGDREGYKQTCKHMLGDKTIRAYLVARACTLSPDSPEHVVSAAEISNMELMKRKTEFWSLCEQGALGIRTNRLDDSIVRFQESLKVDSRPGAAVVNWLWLALAYQKLGNSAEARSWLNKSASWLDGIGEKLPYSAEAIGLHRHNWLEAHVLRREAETLLSEKKPGQ